MHINKRTELSDPNKSEITFDFTEITDEEQEDTESTDCHVSMRLIGPHQKQHGGPLEARLMIDMRTHIYARIRLHILYSIFG